jgi:prepilin-type N-terminal cleavage/methylation domain-containing protein
MKTLKNQCGFSFIEVLVALAIIGLTGMVFLVALQTATKVTGESNVRTTAKNLAVSQMDTIKAAVYIPAPSGIVANYSFSSPPAGFQVYTLDRNNSQVSNTIYGIPWDITSNAVYTNANPADPGIQKMTIIIKHKNKEVFRLIDFKVDR